MKIKKQEQGRKMMREPYTVVTAMLKGRVAAVVINLRSRDCHGS